jgi:hypothetical protein
VDAAGHQLLVNGLSDRFLAERSERLHRTIAAHVDTMAEWGARDGRSLADMMRSVA